MTPQSVETLGHIAVVLVLVILGVVTGDHSLIDAGLAWGGGAGAKTLRRSRG